MNGSAHPPDEPARLESWKEIAAFFHRDVRTVQRWEAREGMPVHRHLHLDRNAVFAFTSELDEWWRLRRPPELPGNPVARADGALPPAESPAAPALGFTPAADPVTPAPPARRSFRAGLGLAGLAVIVAGAVVVSIALGRWRPAAPASIDAAGPPVGRLVANFTREGAAPVRIPDFKDAGYVLALPNGDLYVTAPFEDAVKLVDGRRGTVVRTIAVEGRPARLALAPGGERVYVACMRGKAVVIDPRRHSASVLPGIEWARDVAVTPDGRAAYFALGYAGLARLDVASGTVERLPVVGCPFHVTTDRTRLYVSCQCQGPGGTPGHDAVVVYDLATRKEIGTAQGPPQVGSTLSVSPDGAFLWVNAHDACSAPAYDHAGCPSVPAALVNVYDTATLRPVRSVGLDLSDAGEVGVLPGGRRAYLAGMGLRVVDTRNFAVAESMAGGIIRRPALSPDGRMVWIIDGDQVMGAPALPPSCDLPETGLVDHWPGDGAADDVWGASHGELRGGAGFAPGIVGQAFTFDGVNDEVGIGRRQSLQWPLDGATVMAWVKPGERAAATAGAPTAPGAAGVAGEMAVSAGAAGASGEMAVMGRAGDPGTNAGGWALTIGADGRFAFCMHAGSGGCGSAPGTRRIVGTTRATPGTWHHVAVTWTASHVARLFVNGTQEAEGPLEYEFGSGEPEMKLGAVGDAHRLRGLVDEAAHYGRALDPSEIAAVVRHAADRACTGK